MATEFQYGLVLKAREAQAQAKWPEKPIRPWLKLCTNGCVNLMECDGDDVFVMGQTEPMVFCPAWNTWMNGQLPLRKQMEPADDSYPISLDELERQEK